MERSQKKLPAKTENFGLRVVAPYRAVQSTQFINQKLGNDLK